MTLHNLIHLPEDIERFGSPDNYWCFSFERAVKSYTKRPSNAKNLEHTFARAECRREYLKFNCAFDHVLGESTFHNILNDNTHFVSDMHTHYRYSKTSMQVNVLCIYILFTYMFRIWYMSTWSS